MFVDQVKSEEKNIPRLHLSNQRQQQSNPIILEFG